VDGASAYSRRSSFEAGRWIVDAVLLTLGIALALLGLLSASGWDLRLLYLNLGDSWIAIIPPLAVTSLVAMGPLLVLNHRRRFAGVRWLSGTGLWMLLAGLAWPALVMGIFLSSDAVGAAFIAYFLMGACPTAVILPAATVLAIARHVQLYATKRISPSVLDAIGCALGIVVSVGAIGTACVIFVSQHIELP
jgi:hypothetical protein